MLPKTTAAVITVATADAPVLSDRLTATLN